MKWREFLNNLDNEQLKGDSLMDTNTLTQNFVRAIKNSNLQDLKSLIESFPSQIEVVTVFGTWLHVATSFNADIDIIKYLVKNGIDVNQKGGILGGSALNIAASNGMLDVVNYLLECGAKFDLSEPEKNPLFSAIYGGHSEIVKLFISHKVDILVKYSGNHMNEMDALAFARERGKIEIVDIILDALN